MKSRTSAVSARGRPPGKLLTAKKVLFELPPLLHQDIQAAARRQKLPVNRLLRAAARYYLDQGCPPVDTERTSR
jgi:predicted HicB family RNase H-like nuclease